MKTLIALAAIAAGSIAADQAEISKGGTFDAPDDIADALVADGQAQLADDTSKQPKQALKAVEVRLLVDTEHGRANDLVSLPPDVAKQLGKDGTADDSKAAVVYAKGLPQNAKRKT